MYSWIWILIPLAMFSVPLVGVLLGFWTSWLSYRFRRAALETLKAYASEGREPPAALLEAVAQPAKGPKEYWSDPENWGENWRTAKAKPKQAAADVDSPVSVAAAKETTAEKHERRRRNEVRDAWSGTIWSGAIAGGLWAISFYLTKPIDHRNCLIAAIILAAICAASFLSAIVTTVLRRK